MLDDEKDPKEETEEEPSRGESEFTAKEDPDQETVVDLDEPPEDKPSRQEKKAQRQTNLVAESKAEAERHRQTAEQASRDNQELRERMARMEGRLESSTPQESKADKREKEIQAELRGIGASMQRAGTTQEEIEASQTKAWALQKELSGLWAAGHMEKNRPRQDRRMSRLEIQYGDVLEDSRGVNFYQQKYFARRAELNMPGNQKLPENEIEKCLQWARGMVSGKPEPSDQEKSRFLGSPVGASDSTKKAGSKVVMGPRQKMMADSAFKSVKDPAERHRMWAEKFGKTEKANAR